MKSKIKRIGLIIVNWSLVLTLPIWGGTLMTIFVFEQARNPDSKERDALTGKAHIFD
jgi:hypothetical protein